MSCITHEDLENAKLDVQTLEQFINGDANQTVTARLGNSYHTLEYWNEQIGDAFSGNNIKVFKSITELRAYSSPQIYTEGALLLGKNSIFDGGQFLMYYDPNSFAQDNDFDVIKPNDIDVLGAGRWLKVVKILDDFAEIQVEKLTIQGTSNELLFTQKEGREDVKKTAINYSGNYLSIYSLHDDVNQAGGQLLLEAVRDTAEGNGLDWEAFIVYIRGERALRLDGEMLAIQKEFLPVKGINLQGSDVQGSFTPVLEFQGGGSVTISTASASYQKVGDLVNCIFAISTSGHSYTGNNAGANGNLMLSGLPWQCVYGTGIVSFASGILSDDGTATTTIEGSGQTTTGVDFDFTAEVENPPASSLTINPTASTNKARFIRDTTALLKAVSLAQGFSLVGSVTYYATGDKLI